MGAQGVPLNPTEEARMRQMEWQRASSQPSGWGEAFTVGLISGLFLYVFFRVMGWI